jgi:hypothetical protein
MAMEIKRRGRGGARKGAGRPPGATTKRTRRVANLEGLNGSTPLEHLLAVMRDESQPAERRDRAAQIALPYMHARITELVRPPSSEVKTINNIQIIAVPPPDHVIGQNGQLLRQIERAPLCIEPS